MEEEQGGDGDEAAAAGDAVDEARGEGGEEKQEQGGGFEAWYEEFGHGGKVDSAGEKRKITDSTEMNPDGWEPGAFCGGFMYNIGVRPVGGADFETGRPP
jgi:hypothetical protein